MSAFSDLRNKANANDFVTGMELISFDDLRVIEGRAYSGMTGPKIAVIYNNEVYMLKSQNNLKVRGLKNVELDYANDPISEYIGSHVYALFGIPVHDTILGIYKGKLAVLCKDVAYPGVITEFKYLRNTIFDESIIQDFSGTSLVLEDIFTVIENSNISIKEEVKQRFWDQFVIDTIIGNTDRNNGNWGFLSDGYNFELAPVYDCGGCLNNKRSDRQMAADLDSGTLSKVALNYTSCYINNKGTKINPIQYLQSNCNDYIINSLFLLDKVDIWQINNLIDSVKPVISDIRAEFYKCTMEARIDALYEILSKYS